MDWRDNRSCFRFEFQILRYENYPGHKLVNTELFGYMNTITSLHKLAGKEK
jgi:hypothetical protein